MLDPSLQRAFRLYTLPTLYKVSKLFHTSYLEALAVTFWRDWIAVDFEAMSKD